MNARMFLCLYVLVIATKERVLALYAVARNLLIALIDMTSGQAPEQL
jgi:hypothetical protein